MSLHNKSCYINFTDRDDLEGCAWCKRTIDFLGCSINSPSKTIEVVKTCALAGRRSLGQKRKLPHHKFEILTPSLNLGVTKMRSKLSLEP